MARQKTAKKELDVSLIETARQYVAERYDNPTLKRAIMSGDWDRGRLVLSEAERIRDMTIEQDDTDEE